MKKRLNILLIVLLVTAGIFLVKPSLTYAFSSVLGAKTIGGKDVSINGYQTDDPKNPIMLDTATPTFSGYTIPNASLLLIIRSEPIERETLSDATGYWSYTFDEPLVAGQHTLSLKVTDQYGITSDEVLAVTFTVPEVKGENTLPSPSSTTPPIAKISQVNYLTISLAVIGSLVLLSALYFYLARKPHSNI